MQSKDPLELHKEQLEQLNTDIAASTERILAAVRKANDARDKALATIKQHQAAIEATHAEFMDFINSMEIIRVEAVSNN